MWYSEVVIMCSNKDKLFVEKQWMLDQMFDIVKSVLPVEAYAMKGGYILKSILNTSSLTRNTRTTSDIDLDVASNEYFELIVNSLIPLIESCVKEGRIYKYSISNPRTNVTGNIKLYRKKDENTKAFVFCGIDIAVHPISYGIMMLEDELPCYAIERMLADKFWSMYHTSSKKILYHRIRDLLDIYLIGRYLESNCTEIKEDLLIKCVKSRMQSSGVSSVGDISNIEILFQKYPESVYDLVSGEINNRISSSMRSTVLAEDVINEGLAFINYVLGVIS